MLIRRVMEIWKAMGGKSEVKMGIRQAERGVSIPAVVYAIICARISTFVLLYAWKSMMIFFFRIRDSFCGTVPFDACCTCARTFLVRIIAPSAVRDICLRLTIVDTITHSCLQWKACGIPSTSISPTCDYAWASCFYDLPHHQAAYFVCCFCLCHTAIVVVALAPSASTATTLLFRERPMRYCRLPLASSKRNAGDSTFLRTIACCCLSVWLVPLTCCCCVACRRRCRRKRCAVKATSA